MEPYDSRALASFLKDMGGEMRVQTNGRHCIFDMPDGQLVTVPLPTKRNPVATPMARHVAQKLGKTYAELRAELGHPVINSGKPKRAAKREAPPGCSKRDVKGRITEMHSTLSLVDHAIRVGVRDSSFYVRVHEHLVAAQRDIERAAMEAQAGGVRHGG